MKVSRLFNCARYCFLKRNPYARLERPSYISAALVVEISVGETVVGSVVDDGEEVEHLFLPW